MIRWLKDKGIYETRICPLCKNVCSRACLGMKESESKSVSGTRKWRRTLVCDALSNDKFIAEFSRKADKGIIEKIKDFLTKLADMLNKAIQSFALSHRNDAIVNELLGIKQCLTISTSSLQLCRMRANRDNWQLLRAGCEIPENWSYRGRH